MADEFDATLAPLRCSTTGAAATFLVTTLLTADIRAPDAELVRVIPTRALFPPVAAHAAIGKKHKTSARFFIFISLST